MRYFSFTLMWLAAFLLSAPSFADNGITSSTAPTGSEWGGSETWYVMRQLQTSVFLSSNASYTDGSGNLKLNNTAIPGEEHALWCFVGSETNGYKIYNKAKGTGYVLGLTGTADDGSPRTSLVAEGSEGYTTTFDVRKKEDGYWYIKTHVASGATETNLYLNNRDNYLSIWVSSWAYGAEGSAFTIQTPQDYMTGLATGATTPYATVADNLPAIFPTGTGTSINNVVSSLTITNDIAALPDFVSTTLPAVLSSVGAIIKSAIDGKTMKLANLGSGGRSGRVLSIGDATCVAAAAPGTATDVVTIRCNDDGLSFKLYNGATNKYLGALATPNVASYKATAGNYFFVVESSSTAKVENMAGLQQINTPGNSLIHLQNYEPYNLMAYDFDDAASRWTVSEANPPVAETLQALIDRAQGYCDALLNQEATHVVALKSAITTAQAAHGAESATTESLQEATATLQTAFDAMLTNMVAEASTDQYYRFRTTAFNGNKDMTLVHTSWDGLKTKDKTVNTKDQFFKFAVKSSDDGTFEISDAVNNKFVTHSYWWTSSSVNAGNGTAFTVTYTGEELFTITQGNYGGENHNFFAPGELQDDGTATIYSDQTVNCGRIHWLLEPVSSTEMAAANKALPLVNAISAAAAYENYYDADRAGLPGYLSADQQSVATDMNTALTTARTRVTEITAETTEATVEGYVSDLQNAASALESQIPAVYPTGRYFSIKNNEGRGYVTYEPLAVTATDGTAYLWSTGKNAQPAQGETAAVAATAFSANNVNHLWCFLANEKADGTTEYYLYNAGKKQFARPTKEARPASGNSTYNPYHWIFSDEPAAITLHHLSGHTMTITAQSVEVAGDANVGFSISNVYYGPIISYDAKGDGGLPFVFDWGTAEFAENVPAEVKALVRADLNLATINRERDTKISGLENGQTIGTYSSDKAFTVRSGVTAYMAKPSSTDEGIYVLTAIEAGKTIPANQGVLLVGDVAQTAATLDVVYRNGDEADMTDNQLLGSGAETVTMQSGDYILAKDDTDSGIAFYPAQVESVLPAHKAYFRTSGSVRALTLLFGGQPTGISEVAGSDENENAAVYDLSGRRVTRMQKGGLYIRNGRKFIVK